MTTSKFFNYLNALGLYKIKIWEDEIGIYAIIKNEPFLGDFTQVKSLVTNFYEVKLSKSDYQNELVTGGFFN